MSQITQQQIEAAGLAIMHARIRRNTGVGQNPALLWIRGSIDMRGFEDDARAALLAASKPPIEALKPFIDALEQANVMLGFSFQRIHGLPRSRDTELASDIGKVRAQISAALKLVEPDQ